MHTSRYLIASFIATVILIISITPFYWFNKKPIHISIDDVETCLLDLQNNGHTYRDVFQQPFFHRLKTLHNITGLKITLYIYEESGDYNISKVPERFITDIHKSSWIDMAFHAKNPSLQKKQIIENDAIISSFSNLSCKGLGGARITH